MKFTTPFNENEEINAHIHIPAMRKYAQNIILAMDEIIEPVADIGIMNIKATRAAEFYGINIAQIGIGIDWNREPFPEGEWGTLLFYDSLEHMLNPLFVMDNLHRILKPGGVLYITLPQRPSWLWTEHHWHEIDRSRCEYLFRSAGFTIEAWRVIRYWRFKAGLRPLIRYFYDKSTFYKLRKLPQKEQ